MPASKKPIQKKTLSPSKPTRRAAQALAHDKERDQAVADDLHMILTKVAPLSGAGEAATRLVRRLRRIKGERKRLSAQLAESARILSGKLETPQQYSDAETFLKALAPGMALTVEQERNRALSRVKMLEALLEENRKTIESAASGYELQLATLRKSEDSLKALVRERDETIMFADTDTREIKDTLAQARARVTKLEADLEMALGLDVWPDDENKASAVQLAEARIGLLQWRQAATTEKTRADDAEAHLAALKEDMGKTEPGARILALEELVTNMTDQLSAKENALSELRIRHATETMGAPGSPAAPEQPASGTFLDEAPDGPSKDMARLEKAFEGPNATMLGTQPEHEIKPTGGCSLSLDEIIDAMKKRASDPYVYFGVSVRRQLVEWLRELSAMQANPGAFAEPPYFAPTFKNMSLAEVIRWLDSMTKVKGAVGLGKEALEMLAAWLRETHAVFDAPRPAKVYTHTHVVAAELPLAIAIKTLAACQDDEEACFGKNFRAALLVFLTKLGQADADLSRMQSNMWEAQADTRTAEGERDHFRRDRERLKEANDSMAVSLKEACNQRDAQAARADAIYRDSQKNDGQRSLLDRLIGERNVAIDAADSERRRYDGLKATADRLATERDRYAERAEKGEAATASETARADRYASFVDGWRVRGKVLLTDLSAAFADLSYYHNAFGESDAGVYAADKTAKLLKRIAATINGYPPDAPTMASPDYKPGERGWMMGPGESIFSPEQMAAAAGKTFAIEVKLDTEPMMRFLHSLARNIAKQTLLKRDERLCIFVLARAANFAKVWPDDLRLWLSHFHNGELDEAEREAQLAPSNESASHHPAPDQRLHPHPAGDNSGAAASERPA